MSEKNNNSKTPKGPGSGGKMKPVEKPKNFKGTSKKLLNYLSPYKWKLILVVLFAVLSASFSIVGPKVLGEITTTIFEGLVSKISGVAGGGIDFDSIKRTMIILGGLYVASAIFSYIQGFIVTGIAQRVSYNLRKRISEKINTLPLKYFDKASNISVLPVPLEPKRILISL